MKQIFDEYGYVACPHTAIGIMGLQAFMNDHKQNVTGVALATAHPSKFKPLVEEVLGKPVDVPKRLAVLANRSKHSIRIRADYEAFKESLLMASN